MPFNDLVKLWDKFWFSESSPLPVAVYRVLFGFISILNFLLLIPDLIPFYGARGLTTVGRVTDWTGCSGLNLFNFVQDNDIFLMFCIALFIAASVCFCIGFHSRLAAVILFTAFNSLYHRDPFLLNSGDTYMRVSVFWLIFAASGNAISIDRWRKKSYLQDPPGPAFENYKLVSIWPLRLLQIQLAMVYCHTWARKFWGQHWYDGVAVYYSSRVEDLKRFPLPFIFDQLWTIQFFTYATLGVEFALFTLIWIKETRYYVLAMGLSFHLVIDYHMNIPLFEYLMIISYVLFIYPEDLAKVLRFIQGKFFTRRAIAPPEAVKEDTQVC